MKNYQFVSDSALEQIVGGGVLTPAGLVPISKGLLSTVAITLVAPPQFQPPLFVRELLDTPF